MPNVGGERTPSRRSPAGLLNSEGEELLDEHRQQRKFPPAEGMLQI